MKRKLEVVKGYSGIFRILFLDQESDRWAEPRRGKKFAADGYLNGGKRKRRSFHSFSEAKIYRLGGAVNSDGRLTGEGLSSKQKKGMSFFDLTELWRKNWLPHKAISTQIRYRSYLAHFRFFNDMYVENISPTTIDEWITKIKSIEYLAGNHSTRCDYRHEYSVLKQILSFYSSRYDRNYRLPFLTEHRRMLTVRDKPEVKKDLSVDEFGRFTVALQAVLAGTKYDQIYYLALLQYATYSRVQEAAALHFEDFDFERNVITINKKIVWPRSKDYAPYLADGSKKNGGKTIPLSQMIKTVIQDWMLKSGKRKGLLFSVDDQVLTYRQIEHRYSQALAKAGLPYRATHILRHASLTEFYDSCKDLKQTAQVAGHDSVKSTEKYAKARDERVRETQMAVDEKLSVLFSRNESSC